MLNIAKSEHFLYQINRTSSLYNYLVYNIVKSEHSLITSVEIPVNNTCTCICSDKCGLME